MALIRFNYNDVSTSFSFGEKSWFWNFWSFTAWIWLQSTTCSKKYAHDSIKDKNFVKKIYFMSVSKKAVRTIVVTQLIRMIVRETLAKIVAFHNLSSWTAKMNSSSVCTKIQVLSHIFYNCFWTLLLRRGHDGREGCDAAATVGIGFLNESSTSGWANCCASTYGQHMSSVPMGPLLEVTKFSALASRIGVKIHN